MSPSLGEVCAHIFFLSGTFDALVGSKNFLCKGFGIRFLEVEITGWDTIFIGSFSSVVVEDGSHEEIIRISVESSWDGSVVDTTSEFTGLSWHVVTNHSEIVIRRIRIGGVGLELDEGRGLWVSGVGGGNGSITVLLLDIGVSSVVVDGSKAPDWSLGSGGGEESCNSNCEFHFSYLFNYIQQEATINLNTVLILTI